MPKSIDMTGKRFGSLLVIERTENDHSGYARWKCLCDCGNYTVVRGANLRAGAVRSCGCLKTKGWHRSHSMSKTRIYKTWCAMKSRCNNPKDRSYKDYGGRGIHVCDEWEHDFESFFEWSQISGYSENLTIERKDTNGDYSPANCAWVTKAEQANNRRMNFQITYHGKTQNLIQWCTELGLNYKRVHNRMRKLGMDFETAISMPVIEKKRNKEARKKYG